MQAFEALRSADRLLLSGDAARAADVLEVISLQDDILNSRVLPSIYFDTLL